MPFKTKRRKQSASERRFAFVESQLIYPGVGKLELVKADQAKPRVGKASDGIRIVETVNTSYDLLKILLAAGIIISVQLLLALTLS